MSNVKGRESGAVNPGRDFARMTAGRFGASQIVEGVQNAKTVVPLLAFWLASLSLLVPAVTAQTSAKASSMLTVNDLTPKFLALL